MAWDVGMPGSCGLRCARVHLSPVSPPGSGPCVCRSRAYGWWCRQGWHGSLGAINAAVLGLHRCRQGRRPWNSALVKGACAVAHAAGVSKMSSTKDSFGPACVALSFPAALTPRSACVDHAPPCHVRSCAWCNLAAVCTAAEPCAPCPSSCRIGWAQQLSTAPHLQAAASATAHHTMRAQLAAVCTAAEHCPPLKLPDGRSLAASQCTHEDIAPTPAEKLVGKAHGC